MIIYRVGGDPDYMAIRFQSLDEIGPLDDVDIKNVRLDPSHVVRLEYTFGDPSKDGVVTDCPHTGVGSTLVLSKRAADALEPILAEAGVLVKNDPSHEMQYKTFVYCRQIDALDLKHTTCEEWSKSFILKHEFNAAAQKSGRHLSAVRAAKPAFCV